jgi:acetyltransferase-like isoleucine patch superfamily enzyme
MDRKKALEHDPEMLELYERFQKLYQRLGKAFLDEWQRLPPMSDMLVDRWEKAKMLGFGEGTNVYDNSLVIGDVKVGKECWIGPNTILDGSGGLSIGDYCTISGGVHIYTHDNVKQTLSSKTLPIERHQTILGNNVYVAPNAIITKGVHIGSFSVVASAAFVNKNFPEYSILMGQPAKRVGRVEIEGSNINFIYT